MITTSKLSTARIMLWVLCILLIAAFACAEIFVPAPLLIRVSSPLLLAAFFCLARLWYGPTAGDRAASFHVLGIVIVSFCGLLAVFTQHAFFVDIALAWMLQSFVTTLALAKYLNGKNLGE